MGTKERIKYLENGVENLLSMVEILSKRQKEQDKLIDFLSQYNKDEVIFDIKSCFLCGNSVVKYIYNGKLEEYDFGIYTPLDGKRVVVSNEKSSAILQIGETYYKLDKAKNTALDITDIYKPKTETENTITKTTKKK